ncbi:MAG: PAS domain S-box-containing protein [Gammaproteobacteria bacterium]|jgi:PAS domain S-box-containing protein
MTIATGKPDITDSEQDWGAMLQENEVLRTFVNTSKDALFCIEFLEPVDLTAPEPEIIRQVFENECVWRMCNTAMARLYKLPENRDFNAQNVRFVFPCNPENEKFVRGLIEADFNLDGAQSLDQDYEGRAVYMENDVRGQIADGMLHRMMGTVRNVSQQKIREQELTARLNAMSNVLSAIPDPVLVVDTDGVLQAANPALEWRFGWDLDDLLGQPVDAIVRFPDGFSLQLDLPLHGAERPYLSVEVLNPGGQVNRCEAHVSSFGEIDSDRRIVITLRTEKALRASKNHELSEPVADQPGSLKSGL